MVEHGVNEVGGQGQRQWNLGSLRLENRVVGCLCIVFGSFLDMFSNSALKIEDTQNQ